MPRHVDELRNNDPFPVKPGTNEYRALSFLVSNREYGFTPTEIADRTTISEASVSKTMGRLFEKGLVERSQGVYYVDPERADELKRRLDSIDAAVRLHETAPDDDAYAESGWDDAVSPVDPDRDPGQERSDSDTKADTAGEAAAIVDQLTDESVE